MFKNEHDNSESDTWFFLQKRNLSCTLLKKKRQPEPCCEVRPSEGDIGHLQAGDGGDIFVPVCLVVILVVILDSFFFVLCCNYSLS